MNSDISHAKYLRDIKSVRERASIVFGKAQSNKLNHFDVDLTKLDSVVDYVVDVINKDFANNYDSIPPHGRWQHFTLDGVNRLESLVNQLKLDKLERAKVVVDLITVSVLLDAGAGSEWRYVVREAKTETVVSRSEGLAIASLDMFLNGEFSSNKDNPYRVDANGLRSLTIAQLTSGFQVTGLNPLAGIEGRLGLLVKLGKALSANELVFGKDGRPGNMIDYLAEHETTNIRVVQLETLWNEVLMDGFSSIWTGRLELGGIPLGDAWFCSTLLSDPSQPHTWESIAPFHKLTQWLCYSLVNPLKQMLNLEFEGEEYLTGLPEYRNGGLLVDLGLLKLKDKHKLVAGIAPQFKIDDDVIIEWRAVTIGFLDLILTNVNAKLGVKLSLPQLLEAGTWKAGRKIAKELRPKNGEPPIGIISDGTVF